MSSRVEDLRAEMLALPTVARVWLADCLVESLDPSSDDDWQLSWVGEVDRRWEEIQSGQVTTIPGQAALAQLRERLR